MMVSGIGTRKYEVFQRIRYVYFYPTSSYDMVNEMLLHCKCIFANLRFKNYCISLLLIRSIGLHKCSKPTLNFFSGFSTLFVLVSKNRKICKSRN